ncbi:MAG: PAS domain-containing protein, partial [Candidatus Hydrogenedentes bacterium]|nr:PAS domain-containing protein [Candidatus Hydrogenedentota bacterium]
MLEGFVLCRLLYEHGQPRDFVLLKVNDVFERLTGLTDAVGKKATEIVPGICETDPHLFAVSSRVARRGKPERFELRVNALRQWFSVSIYSPAQDLLIVLFDVITERKTAEQALRDQEESLRRFVEQSPAALAMLDRDMKYLVVSRRWMDDYRLGERSIIGRSHYEVFPEITDRLKEIHRRCLAGAVEKNDEDPFPRADGSTDWL